MPPAELPPSPVRPGRRAVLAGGGPPVPFERAVRVMVAMAGPMVLAVMHGRPDLGALGSIGTLMAPLVGGWTYAQRARRLPALAAVMALAYAVGEALAVLPPAAQIGVGVWAAGAVLVAGLIGSWAAPFAAVSGVVCIIGTGLETDVSGRLVAPLLVGLGGLWVALVFNLGRRAHRWQPEAVAVQQAFASIADYLAAVGGPQADMARVRARQAVVAGWEAVGLHRRDPAEEPMGARLHALLLQAQRLLDASVALGFERRRPLPEPLAEAVRALALTVEDPRLAAFLQTPEPPADAARRMLVCYRLVEETRDAAATAVPAPAADVAPLRIGLRDRARGMPAVRAVRVRTAARLGLMVAAAEAVSWITPGEHGYWVVVTALIVLRSDAAGTNVRAAQRALGTILGVAVAGSLLLAQPTAQVAALGMAAIAYLMPGALARNFLLGSAARTGYALLLIESAMPETFTLTVMLERVLDTVLGAGIAVVASLLLWPYAATRRLPAAAAGCLTSMAALLREAAAGRPADTRRRGLVLYLFGLRSVFDQAVGERRRRWPDTAQFWPVSVLTLRLGSAVRSFAEQPATEETHPILTATGVGHLASALDGLAGAVAAGSAPPPLPWPAGRPAAGLFGLVEDLHRAVAAAARPVPERAVGARSGT